MKLIKTVTQEGQTIPFGLSKRDYKRSVTHWMGLEHRWADTGFSEAETYYLRLPVFAMFGKKYDVCNDEYLSGWWVLTVLFKVRKLPSGVAFETRHGWYMPKRMGA